jgi:hypothetical protein
MRHPDLSRFSGVSCLLKDNHEKHIMQEPNNRKSTPIRRLSNPIEVSCGNSKKTARFKSMKKDT